MIFDPFYFIFVAPALIVGFVATLLLKYWTNKYFGRVNLNNVTGVDIIEKYAQSKNLIVKLEINEGHLTDYYDPSNKVVSLSRAVAQQSSIASVAIAAHEMGHAQQHQSGNILIHLRTILIPAVNLGTQIGYVLFFAGLIIGFFELAWIGIFLFSGALFISLLTLPIEIDASIKAINFLKSSNLLFKDELGGAQKVLFAASLTYVAATLQSLGNLAYFIFMLNRSSRD
jgi:uncharacterized protein